jgi:hypothetical protein
VGILWFGVLVGDWTNILILAKAVAGIAKILFLKYRHLPYRKSPQMQDRGLFS